MEEHNGLKGINRYYRSLFAKRFVKGTILDVGCSDGFFSIQLLKND